MPVAIALSGFQIALVAVFAVAAFGIVVALLTDDRDPTTVIAWLLVVTLLPFVGVVLYFFIGRNYRRETPLRQRVLGEIEAEAAHVLSPVYESCGQFTSRGRGFALGHLGPQARGHGQARGGHARSCRRRASSCSRPEGRSSTRFSTTCGAPGTTSTSCT